MLKGLEITEIRLSELWTENPTGRFDSEYFQKFFLENITKIEKFPSGWMRLGDAISELTGGATPLGADYPENGVRFLRVQNVMQNFIDDSDLAFISPGDDSALSRSRLKKDDVLLTITGVSYGKSAVVTPEFVGSNINQHSVRIELQPGTFEPFFVSTFLNSNPGKLQSDQNITGVTRPALDYDSIRRFRIPCVSAALQTAIARLVRDGQQQFVKAKQTLAEAEKVLLAALGLGNWQPPEPLTYTRRATEVFAADRFDAEYFHPAKKGYLDRLRKMPSRPLGEHYEAVREMFDPTSAAPGEMVRNFDLNDALQPVLDDSREPMPAREMGSSKKRFTAGDVVTSRLRAYLREIALVRTSGNIPSVGSSEFIVLRQRPGQKPALSQAALLTFLRSRPVQTILHWSQDGSHHPRYGEEDLLTITVPDAVCQASFKMDANIEAILIAREKARLLLAAAQRAVEIAIKDSEPAALAYLEKQSK